MPLAKTFEQWLSRRGPAVRERILRLNCTIAPGQRPRGWNPQPTKLAREWNSGAVSKGDFIRKFGRATWDRIPREYYVRDGKRCYLTREAVMDRVWMAAR